MKRLRFTEEQIIAVLKEAEAGAKTGDLARRHGVSEATIYNWKAKYGGMDVSEAQEMKQLREENARLKKLVADLSLDKDMLQSVIRKNHLGSQCEKQKCGGWWKSFPPVSGMPASSSRFRDRRIATKVGGTIANCARRLIAFGTREAAVWLSPIAYSASARWSLREPQASSPGVSSRQLAGEADSPPEADSQRYTASDAFGA